MWQCAPLIDWKDIPLVLNDVVVEGLGVRTVKVYVREFTVYRCVICMPAVTVDQRCISLGDKRVGFVRLNVQCAVHDVQEKKIPKGFTVYFIILIGVKMSADFHVKKQ